MQRFDMDKFNREFEKTEEEQKQINKEKEEEKLEKLNTPKVETKKIYQNTLYDILIGIKNTWLGILDDILNFQYNLETLTKNNRLFYIGITLVIIALIVFFYNYFLE